LDTISLSNIENGSLDLFYHVASMYVFTAMVSVLLFRLYRDYIEMLHEQTRKATMWSRTVMVTGIDRSRIRSDEDLCRYFENLHGKGSVLCAQITPFVERGSLLWNLQKDAEYQLKHLRRAYGVLFRNWADNQVAVSANSVQERRRDEERPQAKLGCLGLVGEQVDALDHFEREYGLTQRQISEVIGEDRAFAAQELTNWGFVTFSRLTTAMLCVQSLHRCV
jgi:calcium permeable stress-gated cation channel